MAANRQAFDLGSIGPADYLARQLEAVENCEASIDKTLSENAPPLLPTGAGNAAIAKHRHARAACAEIVRLSVADL